MTDKVLIIEGTDEIPSGTRLQRVVIDRNARTIVRHGDQWYDLDEPGGPGYRYAYLDEVTAIEQLRASGRVGEHRRQPNSRDEVVPRRGLPPWAGFAGWLSACCFAFLLLLLVAWRTA